MKKNRIRRVPLAVGFAVAVQVLSAVLSGVVFGFNVVSNTAGSSGIIVGLTLPLGFVFWVAAPIALSIGASSCPRLGRSSTAPRRMTRQRTAQVREWAP
jgi:hypothetical protein